MPEFEPTTPEQAPNQEDAEKATDYPAEFYTPDGSEKFQEVTGQAPVEQDIVEAVYTRHEPEEKEYVVEGGEPTHDPLAESPEADSSNG